MTIKEIQDMIDAVNAEYEASKANADGSYNADTAGKYWESLPRIAYSELPAELQAVADEITAEGAKTFLLENYISYHPDGDLSRYEADPALFDRTITEALHAARYEVTSTDTTIKATGNPAVDEAIRQDRPVSLYANDFMAAWDKVTQEKASPRSAAVEKGALMTIGGRIASYSTDDLKDALNAYSIYRLPSNVDRKQAFDDTGKLNALMLQDKPLEGLTQIHTAFLMAVVQAVSLAQIDDGDNTISFYLPAICRDLRIDPRTYSSKRKAGQDYAEMRLAAMLDMITPFDPLVGRTPDGSFYRVLTFESYDKGSDTMTISTPYLYRLKVIAEQRATGQKHPQLNRLMHSSVVNEPNRAAVELANRILTGIVTRGVRADYRTYKAEPKVAKKTVTRTSKDGQRTTTTTVYDTDSQPDDAPAPTKTVTYKVKYQTLIDDCPQLKSELDEIINGKGKAEREAEERNASAEEIKKAREKDKKNIPQRVNKKLKDVFTAAFRIIAEKSDAPARYLDFTLPTTTRTVNGKKSKAYDVPTKSTLARYMVITHRGRNPQYTE